MAPTGGRRRWNREAVRPCRVACPARPRCPGPATRGALTPSLPCACVLRQMASSRAAVAAWTLVPPSLSRRARSVRVAMTMGRSGLRSSPPGLHSQRAAVVMPAGHFALAKGGKASTETVAVRCRAFCPGGTWLGAGSGLAHGTAPRGKRDCGAVAPRKSIIARMGRDPTRAGGAKRKIAAGPAMPGDAPMRGR